MKKSQRYDNYRYDSKLKDDIGDCIEYILKKPYGSNLSNIELAKILKYNLSDEKEFKRFKNTMGKIKNFLIEYGYVLKSIPGIGYYILKPNQISSHCYRTYTKRTQRMLDKSDLILTHVDKQELSKTRLEEYDNMKKLTEDLIHNVEQTILCSGYYSRKNYYENLND